MNTDEAAHTMEHKQHFAVVSPDTLNHKAFKSAYEKLHVKIMQFSVSENQKTNMMVICENPLQFDVVISCLSYDIW